MSSVTFEARRCGKTHYAKMMVSDALRRLKHGESLQLITSSAITTFTRNRDMIETKIEPLKKPEAR